MADVDAIPDRALLRRYAHLRDTTAFEALIERHQAGLLSLAHAVLADVQAAQDAVQEAFMRLCQSAAALATERQEGDSLRPWLCTVVRNHCIDQLRKRANQRMRRMHEELQVGSALSEPAEADGSVWGAVAELPALERAAVVLRYRDGLSYQQIAESMGKTTSHVGVLLHHALGRLRQAPALRAEHS